MIKRLVRLSVLSLVCMLLVAPSFGHAQTLPNVVQKDQQVASFNEMQDALSHSNVAVDLSKPGTKTEKVVKNKKGETVGTLGVELVKTQETKQPTGGITALTTTSLSPGTTYTFKVYWYTVLVNYSFYTDVYVSSSTGLGKIVSAYDPHYLVIPPGVVSRDTLSIIRTYETSSYAAEARYTLNMSAPVSTNLYIYGKVKNKQFISGGN